MSRNEWRELADILLGLLLALVIGAIIVLLIFGIGGFPPE